MPWPSEVPVFTPEMIHQGFHPGAIGWPTDLKTVSSWFGTLFRTSSPEWTLAVRRLAALCEDDSFPSLDDVGYLSSLILWGDKQTKPIIATTLNRLMARLGYSEDA